MAWLTDPELSIGVSRTLAHYSPGSRYNSLHISKRLIDVVDAMLAQGLVDQHLGSEISGKVTRIWACETLVSYFKQAAFSEFMIGTAETRETVILNSRRCSDDEDHTGGRLKVPKPLEYEDHDDPRIIPTRALLKRYNALLAETHIDLGSQDEPSVASEYYNRASKVYEQRRVSLSQQNKFVRRVFYRGDWNLGGRYHGGWWQQIRGDLRKHILINGDRTFEVDFSGFHVALAFALEYHEPPSDPYTLSTLTKGFTKEQQRSDVKLLALTALNADSQKAALSAFRDQRNKDQRQLPRDQKISYTDDILNSWLEGFSKKHSAIKHYICSDKGVELMALDGNITTRIIEHFTALGEPILTVHDSYIVRSGQEEMLSQAMLTAVSEETEVSGFNMKSSLKHQLKKTMTFKGLDRSYNDYEDYRALAEPLVTTKGYVRRLERFNRFKAEYLGSVVAP